ncbi:Rpn family recombination-promoting nuclease/putative transposase [Moorella sp. Hama-1]|uniref:Rpn family recombination-promoting nuclease/putative transposase n=1 Tax=Moorella sp. Hama-1 TaxID=2138101 RepID=UPI000D651C07|nr:Rpn family recombination-promoting nuclease/putative transposase [Moorella sp. Hama-1]BCV20163.1 hypothetical protein hamaS1_02320 [Moorella sp. Hama-1]
MWLQTTKEGTLINIEIQVANQYNVDKRIMYYWAALYHGQLTSGQKFADLRKIVTIFTPPARWKRQRPSLTAPQIELRENSKRTGDTLFYEQWGCKKSTPPGPGTGWRPTRIR